MTRRCTISLQAHPWEKLAWHAALGIWMGLCYYPPQVWPLFSAGEVPLLLLEPQVPFSPVWVLVYQSVFLLHTAAIWLPVQVSRTRSYCLVVGISFLVGAGFFWFLPMKVAQLQTDSWLYHALIASVDGPRNAFPSLHAAMATAGLLWVRALVPARVTRMLALWWLALLYSALAVGQHRLIDLVAGIGLVAIVVRIRSANYSTLREGVDLP